MFQDGSHEIIWLSTTLAVRALFSLTADSLQVHWKRGQPKKACAMTPLLDLSLHTTSYNTSWNQLPSCRAYHLVPTAVDAHCWEMWQFWSEDKHRHFICICTKRATKQNCLNLNNALLIPCISLSVVSCTINFLFKVLFIFPSWYLFTIGLVPIFALEGVYLPFWATFPGNPTHRKGYVTDAQCVTYGIVTLQDCAIPSNLNTVHPVWRCFLRLQFTVASNGDIKLQLFPLHLLLLGESLLVSFSPLINMLKFSR